MYTNVPYLLTLLTLHSVRDVNSERSCGANMQVWRQQPR